MTWIIVGVGVALVMAGTYFLMLYRPVFTVSAIDAPEAVVSGEDVTVSVVVANSGLGSGEHELTLLVDGTPAKTAVVTVAGGGEERVDVVLEGLDPGRYAVSVLDVEGLHAAVWVMTPALLVVDSVFVTPNPLDINTSTEASATVQISNLGEAPGSDEFELTVDGVATEARTVSLDGGATTEESFTFAVSAPGTRDVQVNGTSTLVQVNQIERPANGTVFVNSLGGGQGELRITNSRSDDLLVVVTAPGDGQPALLSVYVQANSSSTITGIANGVYSVYYAFGTDWCTYAKVFTRSGDQGRFSEDASYESGSTFFTYYTIDMGGAGEGAPTEYVPPDSFPAL